MRETYDWTHEKSPQVYERTPARIGSRGINDRYNSSVRRHDSAWFLGSGRTIRERAGNAEHR